MAAAVAVAVAVAKGREEEERIDSRGRRYVPFGRERLGFAPRGFPRSAILNFVRASSLSPLTFRECTDPRIRCRIAPLSSAPENSWQLSVAIGCRGRRGKVRGNPYVSLGSGRKPKVRLCPDARKVILVESELLMLL
jgi:hypothetical protein